MRLACLSTVALLLFCPSVTGGHGDGTFGGPLRITGVPTPLAIAAGDFNHDGKLDLATVNGGTQLVVLVQDPASRVLWTRQEAITIGISNFLLRAADLDGDGADDLVLADPGSTANVLLSKGDGTFQPGLKLPQSAGSRWIAVGDWDGDGKLDLASANQGGNSVTIYRGRGTGGFDVLKSLRMGGGRPHSIEALDYDGDGKLDLMVGVNTPGIVPLKGNGDGTFLVKAAVPGLQGCYWSLATGDFNHDGLGDLVTPCEVAIGEGDGLFIRTAVAPFQRYGSPIVADLNGDGHLDVATPCGSWICIDVGKGDGTFLPSLNLGPIGFSSNCLAASDLDGDRHVDLVAGDGVDSSLAILWGAGDLTFHLGASISGLGSAKSLAIADLDRDGMPDLFFPSSLEPRIQIYLKSAGAPRQVPSLITATSAVFSTILAADLDGDGTPDLAGTNLGRGTALVALLDPAGKVRSEAALPAGSFPATIAAGRIDADGNVDLAVPCSGSNHVAIFLAVGGGAFAEAQKLSTIKRPKDLALGDLDADGIADLAVIATEELAIHRGTGNGQFSGPVTLERNEAKRFSQLNIADMDRDSFPDLVLLEGASVRIYRGDGGTRFDALSTVKLDSTPVSLGLADLDGNGLLDLTTCSSAGQFFSVVLNRGALTFDRPVAYPLGFGPLGHRLADLNLDGALDVVAFSSTAALVLLGRPVPAASGRFVRGDAGGDGRMEVNDAIAILSRLFLGGEALPCEDAADANDDGELNLTDPIALLSRLFLGGEPLPPPGACGEDPTPDRLAECRGSC